jgi:hypothetical protein
MNLTRVLLLAALFAAPLNACNCGEEPLSRTEFPDADPPIFLDAGFGKADASEDAGAPDTGEPEARVLTFDGTSPVALYFGSSRDLRFTLRSISGANIAGESVRFSFLGTGGMLSAPSAVTDVNGVATVRFDAGAVAGGGTVTADADFASSATVEIRIGEDPDADLIVDVATNARIPLSSADAMIYVGPAATVPTCAQLLAAVTPPAPTFNATYTTFPGSQTFANLLSGSTVTVIAHGENAQGVLVARGCSEGVRLVGGTGTHILVTLEQLPAQLDGDYDALLLLDIGATFPPPYGTTIVLITEFLSDPAGWVVYQTLAELDQQLGTSFIEWTPPTGPTRPATFPEVLANRAIFNVWQLGRDLLHNFLVQELGQAYVDFTLIGADVAHAVRSFEVGAGYTITSTGAPGRVVIDEEWKALVFQWQLGCPLGDLGCARRAVQLSGPNAHLAPAQATYGATIIYTPTTIPVPGESERYTLILDDHAMNLRYGAMVLLVLNTIVFPNLPPPLNGNNLTQVIGNLVNCPDVAIQLEAATGLPAVFFEGVCNTGVAAAATYIENQLLQLDSSSTPGLVVGGGGEIVLVDHDRDLATELVESVLTFASWSTGQAIATNITGDGRRAAVDCSTDADCLLGTLCVPIGSYLKVRDTELDCRRPVGMGLAASPCTLDADCASGLCFDAGGPTNICFGACAGAGSCAIGTCVADAAAIDLNALLMGLGDASTAACVP